MKITGLHHVTAIAGDPQRNLDFYAGTLGLRLVKRTINFDDPGSYHLYYGDETGAPGSILTFFPWQGMPRGSHGSGEVTATALTVPTGSIEHWAERLQQAHVPVTRGTSFGEEVLSFSDPDGLPLELAASALAADDPRIAGVHHVTLTLDDPRGTAQLLTDVFGYTLTQQADARCRYTAPGDADIGQHIDLLAAPGSSRARQGAGSVHHLAFRVRDAAEQAAWREKLVRLGHQVSPVRDRTYFESIYFRSPGGVLFEIATDAPGFAVDEPLAELGQHLRLPSWLENTREIIESNLPTIHLPASV